MKRWMICIGLIGVVSVFDAKAENANQLIGALKGSHTPEAISKIVAHNYGAGWQKFDPNSSDGKEVTLALMTSLKNSVRKAGSPKKADLLGLVSIINALVNSGGYFNLLAADSVMRLLVFEVSSGLINGAIDVAFAKKCLNDLRFKEIDTYFLVANQVPAAMRVPLEKMIADKKCTLLQVMPVLGVDENSMFRWSALEGIDFHLLVEQPSWPKLIWRIANTQALLSVHLSGLVAFVERGGNISDLDPSDITRFKALFENRLSEFEYRRLGIRKLSVYYISYMYDLSKGQDIAKRYMSIIY